MELVGTAASILAVAGTTLQSVKFIHDTIQGVKNGPQKVQRATQAVESLQSLLEAIQSTAKQSKRSLGQADSKCLNPIEPLLDQCASDLKSFENFLREVKPTSGSHLGSTLKGQFSLFMSGKEFQGLYDVVQRHVQTLNSCLSNAGL
jgi:uncharacterized protein YukE